MNRTILIIFLYLPLHLIAQDKIQFFNENIDFSLNEKEFSVNGLYTFINSNEQSINQVILFPFAKETDCIFIHNVYNLTYDTKINFQKTREGIIFKLFIFPGDTIVLNVAFSQLTCNENVYILESTQTWSDPLYEANYSLTYDSSVKIDSLSLKPDTLINNVYYWNKTNYYPKKNFIIWIE